MHHCLQEERKQASFEQLLKVANSEREVHEAELNFIHMIAMVSNVNCYYYYFRLEMIFTNESKLIVQ